MEILWSAKFEHHRVTIENDDSITKSTLIAGSGFTTKLWCEAHDVSGEKIHNYYIGGDSLGARSQDVITDMIKRSSMRTTLRLSEAERSYFIHLERCSEIVPDGIVWIPEKRAYLIDPMRPHDMIGITNLVPANADNSKPYMIGFRTHRPDAAFPKFFMDMQSGAMQI